MQMNRVPQRKQTSKRVYGLKKCPNVDFKQGYLAMTEKEADDYLFQHWDEIIKEASDTGESLNIILARHTGIDSKTAAKLIDSAWLTYQVCKRG